MKEVDMAAISAVKLICAIKKAQRMNIQEKELGCDEIFMDSSFVDRSINQYFVSQDEKILLAYVLGTMKDAKFFVSYDLSQTEDDIHLFVVSTRTPVD
jgi:hypothetical protein